MRGRKGIESAYLETLQTETAKRLMPFPKYAEATRTPHATAATPTTGGGCPEVDKFEEYTTRSAL